MITVDWGVSCGVSGRVEVMDSARRSGDKGGEGGGGGGSGGSMTVSSSSSGEELAGALVSVSELTMVVILNCCKNDLEYCRTLASFCTT